MAYEKYTWTNCTECDVFCNKNEPRADDDAGARISETRGAVESDSKRFGLQQSPCEDFSCAFVFVVQSIQIKYNSQYISFRLMKLSDRGAKRTSRSSDACRWFFRNFCFVGLFAAALFVHDYVRVQKNESLNGILIRATSPTQIQTSNKECLGSMTPPAAQIVLSKVK